MNKSDITRLVYEKLDKKHSMKELDVIIDSFLSVVSDALIKGDEVQLSDFGTFSLTQKSIQPVVKTVKKKK